MQYRTDRYGNKLSVLGFGCMRFRRRGTAFDLEEAERELLYAVDQGVNYFDTAYIYSGNEVLLGKIFSRNKGLREKINLATKLPHYLMKSIGQVEKTFQEELTRLQTDHIDYYLMHMVTDIGSWEKMVGIGIEDWIRDKKKSGQIRQIGFSFHGNTDMFLKVLNAYDWDFCQVQYNYMDEFSQAGRRGVRAAYEKGIPVIIMEPLRGGRLVNQLPSEAKEIFSGNAHGWSPAEWGLRWLWKQKEITLVLSGMNSMDMVNENIRIAGQVPEEDRLEDFFGEEDQKVLDGVKDAINRYLKVGCTGCSYCMPCRHGVDIPGSFRCWNEMYIESKKSGRTDYFRASILRHKPTSASLCVRCGACERRCPQSIPIRQKLQEAARDLETPVYKAARAGVKLLHLW